MRNLKDAKDIYDHIVVPEELDDRLRKVEFKRPVDRWEVQEFRRGVKTDPQSGSLPVGSPYMFGNIYW